MPDLRVMIVAEDTLSRAGLAALLGNQSGVLITGQVAAGGDLAGAVDVYRPEVVLWDLGWDPSASLVRLANWRETAGLAAVPLVVLLAHAERAAEVWGAGVRGLLLREAGAERLAAALRGVAEGLAVLDPGLAGALVATRNSSRAEVSPPLAPLAETLTPREIEVLRLLAEGLPNKAIARRLAISEHTVKFHVNAILGKLGVESRTEAVVRATRLGLVLL